MAPANVVETLALWSHATAAALFGSLMIWTGRQAINDHRRASMSLACAATAFWALTVALAGRAGYAAQIGEAVRNLGWLGYMYVLWRQAGGAERAITLVALYITLAVVIVLSVVASMAPAVFVGSPRLLNAAFFSTLILDMMVAVSALMLVHNLYTAATNDARALIRMPMIALSIMWAYDLNLFTLSYLSGSWSQELLALRGLAVALTAPLLALSVMQTGRSTINLSRSATFQSLSLVAIGGYLIIMVLVSSIIQAVAADYARIAQVAFVFGSSVAGLFLLPSPRFRAWFRVKLSKHLFQHRYDYRAEWLRFTDTIGRPSDAGASLEVRIIQAMADITESPGGALLIPGENGHLSLQARWNWTGNDVPAHAAGSELASFFLETGRIVELDTTRKSTHGHDAEASAIPQWLIQDNSAWAVVPLVHFEKLSGVVILQRPLIDRTFDWEDFDLLRVVGRQLASYIAEARGQETLAHVQQFDEFNRRFAFIMHDIKNLVSQLSLVTRNAEKHAQNPEFQADMIATLKSSTARMNEMLARLSQHNRVETKAPVPTEAGPLLEQVAASKRVAHPIVLGGDLTTYVLADPARLAQALSHLVQNAIDVSAASDPVTISAKRISNEAVIEVSDRGSGMSTHFIRHSLFKPFASTKEAGFGIGAFEARSLITAMNGRIDVISREGDGTTFRIILPMANGNLFNLDREPEANAA
jgi:putative PEP-CTERM system histidine kinase